MALALPARGCPRCRRGVVDTACKPAPRAARRQRQWSALPAPTHLRPSQRLAAVPAAQKEEVEGAYCLPAFVNIDNKRSKCFSVLDVEVVDYPGKRRLLRVLSWTLNGLDVVAQNAVVRTSEESGVAHNTFWLTNRAGQKLDDQEADLLAERVRDLVTYCSPDESAARKTEVCAGPIHISSGHHDAHTVLTVREPKPTPGFLLEVASALSGMNICILQGVVQGVTCDDEEDTKALDKQVLDEKRLDESTCWLDHQAEGRTFLFWLRNSQGQKLDYAGMTALVYTLSSVLGYRSHPTVPPDQEMLLNAR